MRVGGVRMGRVKVGVRVEIIREGLPTSLSHEVLRLVSETTLLQTRTTLGMFPWQLEVDHSPDTNTVCVRRVCREEGVYEGWCVERKVCREEGV